MTLRLRPTSYRTKTVPDVVDPYAPNPPLTGALNHYHASGEREFHGDLTDCPLCPKLDPKPEPTGEELDD